MLLFLSGEGAEGGESWPVKGEIDISSGFCDFRTAHFHGGVDIRTGGAEGREAFSPVDGYVWRLRYSYTGYGKALYLKDSEGNIYVFGHLSRLADRLEKWVKNKQYRTRRYYLDHEFPPDSLPVKQGELIAYSGQSGSGPPHLHFEKRTAANVPLNPLTNGFPLADRVSPEMESVGFIYLDSNSLFANGRRKANFRLQLDRGERRYYTDSVLYLEAPFGIETKAFDRISHQGPLLNIYKARLFIDDSLYYETEYDHYDYAETKMVDLCYDYYPAVADKNYHHLLFNPAGKYFSGSKSQIPAEGIFSEDRGNFIGLHSARIEVYDAAGNKSDAEFSFFCGPPGNLFEYEKISDTVFYLIPVSDARELGIKEVAVYTASGNSGWRRLPANLTEVRKGGGFRITLPAGKKPLRAFRVVADGFSRWRKEELYISQSPIAAEKYQLSYELSDNGILFNVSAAMPFMPAPKITVQYADGYSKVIECRAVTPSKFAAFYRNPEIGTAIIGFGLIDQFRNPANMKEVYIALAGKSKETMIFPDEGEFQVTFQEENFYAPTYIKVSKGGGWFLMEANIVGDVYSVTPEIIPLAEPVTVSFISKDSALKKDIGLCHMAGKNGWNWMKSKNESGRVSVKSGFLGTFALLKDDEAPSLKRVSPQNQKTIQNGFPEISCLITDDLSGIEDDNGITILLDGRWLIPEYDPETTVLKTFPDKKLAKGKHTLEITAQDRAGNKKTVKSEFLVGSK
ncbi:MAG: M23 family metallopeptidase [candidate division Zixibacteria bacterium]|nr:M23 family metallopeptidase [candidate division Zixibacteria bacterium]